VECDNQLDALRGEHGAEQRRRYQAAGARHALLKHEADPVCRASTEPSTAAVSGATVTLRVCLIMIAFDFRALREIACSTILCESEI
jgi:hypothetical protein